MDDFLYGGIRGSRRGSSGTEVAAAATGLLMHGVPAAALLQVCSVFLCTCHDAVRTARLSCHHGLAAFVPSSKAPSPLLLFSFCLCCVAFTVRSL